MGWDATRLSRIERGLYRISGEDVRSLCEKYGVEDQAAIGEVAKVSEDSPGRGWWAPYAGRVSSLYLDFIELEAEAESIRIHHPVVIPGPVQSPGYVREILTGAANDMSEMLVSIRMGRQEILARTEKPVTFHALVPESALHAKFASGPAIMRDQIRKLLDLSDMPTVTIQVVPLTAHPAFVTKGPMTLLSFRHPWSTVASLDNPIGGTHTEDPGHVKFLEGEFDAISSIALPVDESRDLLSNYLEGLHK
jgi:hypothetical protein